MHIPSMKRLVWSFSLSLLLINSGCGTAVSHFGACHSPPPGVYRGTVFDANAIAEGLVFWVVDLPLSVAADTILFPIDFANCHNGTNKKDETPMQPFTGHLGGSDNLSATPGADTGVSGAGR
jgi:uncharacterized protein YceK